MKTVILAGGFGTRIHEYTNSIPKPMIEIGGKPILWHIMKIYAHYGFNEFIIALGYKSEVIKDYFLKYFMHHHDISIDLSNGQHVIHQKSNLDWKIHLIDTGLSTMTGGRIKKLKPFIGNETFFMTYGDGLSNININELLKFHKTQNKLATVTAVRPPARFGTLETHNGIVTRFKEKNHTDEGWINGGFFVLEPRSIDFIDSFDTSWEKEPMERLAEHNQLCSYEHNCFWQPMDNIREHKLLEKMWETNSAPWKLWE